jgi:hypothetical protein
MSIVGKLPIDTSTDSQKVPTITPTGTIRRSRISAPLTTPPELGATHPETSPQAQVPRTLIRQGNARELPDSGAWHLGLPADRREPPDLGATHRRRVARGSREFAMDCKKGAWHLDSIACDKGAWHPDSLRETARPTSEGCGGGRDYPNYTALLRFRNVHNGRRTAVQAACGLGDPPDCGSAPLAPSNLDGTNRSAAHTVWNARGTLACLPATPAADGSYCESCLAPVHHSSTAAHT